MSKNQLAAMLVGFLLATPFSNAAAETLWIPAAASNAGLHGTEWTTDLWIYSGVRDETVTVTATFFPASGDSASQDIEVPPNRPVEINDAVQTLFNRHEPGAIRLECRYPIRAQSRTINSGGSTGVFGQGIPAYSEAATAPGFTLLGATNLPTADGVRTNVGIVNTASIPVTVNVIARDPDLLDLIGIATVEIGPYRWYQTDLFDLLGVAQQPIELADVSVFPTGSQLVYISRIDNRSGDGAFIFGSSGESIEIAGNPDREFEVRTEITYDDGVIIDWLKWMGSDEFVYTTNPESGYVTEPVVKYGPVEYCVDVVGRTGPSVSGVTVSIQTRPPGGEWSGGSASFARSGNSQIDQEFCKLIN
jgi:hypothetical protein